MALRYKDKVTIVSGGSNGIGEGCVRVFVKNGAKVIILDVDGEKGKRLETELNAAGHGQAVFMFCDVCQEQDIKNVIAQVVEKFDRIDCLINNAGTHPMHMPIDDFSADDFRQLLNLNVVSYFLLSKYCLPHLRQTEGCIINTSSLVASIGQPGAVTYCATKGAVSAMTKALAIDEAKHNVRVIAYSPSNIWTDIWVRTSQSTDAAGAFVRDGAERQVLGRYGTPEECGLLCLYLAAEATFITGADIPLSGGAELSYGKKTQ